MNIQSAIRTARDWWLFSRDDADASLFGVIKWWELRRIPYNLIVGICGAFTCIVTVLVPTIASAEFGEPLGLPDPPILAVLGVILYAIAANVCYTGGWVAELVVRAIWNGKSRDFAQISFILGLLFSVALTLAPAAILSSALIIRLLDL